MEKEKLSYYTMPGLIPRFGEIQRPRDIINVVCATMDITPQEIKSRTRKHEIVWARQLAMWWLKKIMNLSLTEIGRIFKRNHATVIHAIKTVDNLVETDPNCRKQHRSIKTHLNYGMKNIETVRIAYCKQKLY
jgi:chromosomal replication initiation ATPase DnaA